MGDHTVGDTILVDIYMWFQALCLPRAEQKLQHWIVQDKIELEEAWEVSVVTVLLGMVHVSSPPLRVVISPCKGL